MSNDVQTTLVILLSVGYLTLVVVSIIIAVLLINILRSVRRMTERAEEASENISDIIKTTGKRLAPVALSSMVGIFMKKYSNRRKAKYYEDEDD